MNKQRTTKYFIRTLGCQMNHSDSERISSVLQQSSLEESKTMMDADVIVFNTCSVRQSAEDRILGLKRNIRKMKSKRNTKLNGKSLPITIVTGCMCKRSWDDKIELAKAQENKYLIELNKRLSWADFKIPITQIKRIPSLLNIEKNVDNKNNYLDIKPTLNSRFSAYVPISTGCDEFCTYCIVPFARGKQKDLPASNIINEVTSLVNSGCKEIFLLGQSVNSWQNPGNKYPNIFKELLEEIDNIGGDFWLSFLSSHPKYFTEELIDYFIESILKGNIKLKKSYKFDRGDHIRPYLNLALQSGSDRVLKRMNRKYTSDQFYEIAQKLQQNIPNLNLSTDIIVGFPGETENDFKKTMNIMKKVKFDMAYINKYSPREGTASSKMNDNVSYEIKKSRENKLNAILRKTALVKNKKYVGKKTRVLVEKEKIIKGKKYLFGKTYNYKNILIPKEEKIMKGTIAEVLVTEATSWNLMGKFT